MIEIVLVKNDIDTISIIQNIILKKDNDEIVCIYMDLEVVINKVNKLQPDLVIVDISNLNFTKEDYFTYISKSNLDVKVIFISEKPKDAFKAFEYNVFDFMIKPINEKSIYAYLEKLIQKKYSEVKKTKVEVCLFKHLHIRKDNQEVKNIKWRTTKTKELFTYLCQNNDEVVRKDILIDLFWPEIEVSNAYENLYTTIYYIRSLFKELEIDIQINNTVNGYEIDFKDVERDFVKFNQLIDDIESNIYYNINIKNIEKRYQELVQIYKGDYLELESYIWKEHEQQKYRIKFLALSKQIIELYTSKQEYANAILTGLYLQKLFPYMDYPYFILMQLYDKFGDPYNVDYQYK